MKKFIFIILASCMLLAGCADNLVMDGRVYKPYGLINQNDRKVESIQYEPVWGNIIWGCILFQTIIAPVYFFGFSMFEPVGVKNEDKR